MWIYLAMYNISILVVLYFLKNLNLLKFVLTLFFVNSSITIIDNWLLSKQNIISKM